MEAPISISCGRFEPRNPDPCSGLFVKIRIRSRFSWSKFQTLFGWEKICKISGKNPLFYSLSSMKGFQATGEASRGPRKNIQQFQTWNICTFFLFCGSFLSLWIRTRIPSFYPDPPTAKHWLLQQRLQTMSNILSSLRTEVPVIWKFYLLSLFWLTKKGKQATYVLIIEALFSVLVGGGGVRYPAIDQTPGIVMLNNREGGGCQHISVSYGIDSHGYYWGNNREKVVRER